MLIQTIRISIHDIGKECVIERCVILKIKKKEQELLSQEY